jgi:hypothetical protein
MTNLEGCQIPCLPRLAEGFADIGRQPLDKRIKRSLAKVWNNSVKKVMKKVYYSLNPRLARFAKKKNSEVLNMTQVTIGILKPGDMVRVRSHEEIQATLDPWKELKGCAFLEYMGEYCGTSQRVLQSMERFLDERDYKVKKARGIILLEGVICRGTPVFGRCDRCCYLFWREEWLEKIESA